MGMFPTCLLSKSALCLLLNYFNGWRETVHVPLGTRASSYPLPPEAHICT